MKNTIFTVKVLLAMLISTISQWGFAQESTRIHVSSALNKDETISIDGQLIENVWTTTTQWSGDFIAAPTRR